MRLAKFSLSLAIAAQLCSCASPPVDGPGAAHVFVDGAVYTLDPAQPWVSAVVVAEGRIAYAGEDQRALEFVGRETIVHDLHGRMLLPGFIDAHAHPMMAAGGGSDSLQIDPDDDADAIKKAVARYARKHPDVAVVMGFGFGAAQFGPDGPDKRVLDAAVSDRPVILVDEGGHSAWGNSRAFEVLRIDRDTPDPIPGAHYYKRDARGEPTGWMLESQTFMPALAKLGTVTVDGTVEGAGPLLALWSSVGVTAIFDAGMSAFEPVGFEALARLDREGRLPLRVVGSHMIQHPKQVADAVDRFIAQRSRYSTERVRVGSIKIHNDGTIEARTAAMLEHWVGEPDNRGGVLLERDELSSFVTRVDAAGIDIHIHVIGDRAIRQALDAVEAARKANGDTGTRITLCHVELIHDDDLPRFAPLDVIVQATPVWHVPPRPATAKSLGPERVARLERFAPLVRDGVRVTFGSDFPASGTIRGISPLHNIETGMTRQRFGNPEGEVLGGEAQRLDLETLLRGYTLDAAFQLRLEDEVGSIEVGKRADLIVLGANLFEVDPHAIHDVRVRLTMVGGEIVHERGLRDWIIDRYLGL
ncbi:MAG: amidohydrolase [bacterium]|nr:amidohydrolase [bacterium]